MKHVWCGSQAAALQMTRCAHDRRAG